jgi:DNA polymerase-3 subunit delta'
MLKMLEEPPNNTHIILTAPEPFDLLTTIVSRCQHVSFRPIAVDTIVTFLKQLHGMDGLTARCIAMLSKGSLGGSLEAALSADAEAWMARREELMAYLVSISEAPLPSLFDLADKLSRDKEGLQEALDMMHVWFRDVLIWKFCPDNILNTDYGPQIEKISAQRSEDDLLKKIAAVSSTQQKIARNANRRLALEVLLMTLGDAGDRPQPNGP